MKGFLKLILVAWAGVMAGAYLHECQRPHGDNPERLEIVRDTVTFVDTIPYLLPPPAKETAIGTKIVYLPVPSFPIGNNDSINISSPPVGHLKGLDSVAVEIPITQKEYEAEEYHAWVSGYDPKLDSIYVYPRREMVSIRESSLRSDHSGGRKRWGIGVFAGYGYTPQGFQPCAGISVNYNLWNF